MSRKPYHDILQQNGDYVFCLRYFPAQPPPRCSSTRPTLRTGVPAQERRDASAVVDPLISEFGAPSDWAWIIVCDEAK